jgi:hypothetical protein
MRNVPTLVLTVFLSFGLVTGGETYRQPPGPVLEVLDAPWPPSAHLSPTRDTLVLADRDVYSTLEERAAPYLKLAGVRVDPRSNARYGRFYRKGFTILRLKDHRERRVEVPQGGRLSRQDPTCRRVSGSRPAAPTKHGTR